MTARLTLKPYMFNRPLGPLLIRGPYPVGSRDATALGFVRGRPFKMIVLVARDMETDIALTGTRCSDGQALRFYLNRGSGPWSFGPSSTPVPDDVMAATGDLRAVLPRIVGAAKATKPLIPCDEVSAPAAPRALDTSTTPSKSADPICRTSSFTATQLFHFSTALRIPSSSRARPPSTSSRSGSAMRKVGTPL